jgi:hypothetical protein
VYFVAKRSTRCQRDLQQVGHHLETERLGKQVEMVQVREENKGRTICDSQSPSTGPWHLAFSAIPASAPPPLMTIRFSSQEFACSRRDNHVPVFPGSHVVSGEDTFASEPKTIRDYSHPSHSLLHHLSPLFSPCAPLVRSKTTGKSRAVNGIFFYTHTPASWTRWQSSCGATRDLQKQDMGFRGA